MPSVIVSVIVLLLAVPLSLKEELSGKLRLFIFARFALLFVNCTIWYFMRNKLGKYTQLYVFCMYICMLAFSFGFHEAAQGPFFEALAPYEYIVNTIAFMIMSTFLTQSIRLQVFGVVPSFLAVQIFVQRRCMGQILNERNDTAIMFYSLLQIVAQCIILTVVQYRLQLGLLEFALLKKEEQAQIENLLMVLNKQSDGIALIK